MCASKQPLGSPGRGQRVAFVQRYCVESLGLMHLSAELKRAGHETRLFIEGLEEDLLGAVAAWQPDLLGVQLITGQHPWALEVAAQLKERLPGLGVVFGGPHGTFVPEIIEGGGVDVVVRGEGEGPLVALCDALRDGHDWSGIAGTWTRGDEGRIHRNELAPPVQDIEALAFPDRALFYRYPAMARRRSKSFAGGRGCGQPCSFCHNHGAMRLFRGMGDWVRRRSPEGFIAEIEQVRDQHAPLGVVNFENDDDILSDRGWYEAFFSLYRRRIGIPFFIMTRADHLSHQAARLLKDAGCVSVALALETANDTSRRRVLRKGFSAARFEEAMASAKAQGLETKVYNMVGIPGETFADALATLDLNLRVQPTWAMCSLLQPYPGTDLRRQCIEDGILLREARGDDQGNSISPLFFQESPLDIPDIEAIVNLQKLFSLTVQVPALRPAVERLARLPRNRVFDLAATIVYGLQGARSHRLSLGETIRLARCSRG